MADEELISDLLSRLEERYDLDHFSSIDELSGVDAELREQLLATPDIAAPLQRGLLALQKLNACFGCQAASASEHWPDIPGYEVQGELGFGGMGAVYKARQATLNRTVALKVVLGGRLVSRRAASRFRAEAETVARLRHPNIVQIFETGEFQGVSFIVLEYIGGGNLAGQAAGNPPTERRAAEAIRTIALAIDHAHHSGIVHRDLKPSNILVAADGTLKVADFGLAKLLDDETDLTRSGEAPGTPNYMAPEQARGIVSPQSDIYALGAILYELLTGRAPFSAETLAETLVQVQTRDPVSPSLLRPQLDRDLEAICLKCLEKTPQRRYGTAGELSADLERFLAGKTTMARPLSTAGRVRKWARRQPGLAGLLATVLLLLMGISAVSAISAFRINLARKEAEQSAHDERTARTDAEKTRDELKETLSRLAHSEAEVHERLHPEYFQLAYNMHLQNNTEVAKRYLEKIRDATTAAPTFEWQYLWEQIGGNVRQFQAEAGEIHCVYYTRDGKELIAGTSTGYLLVCDAKTLAPIHRTHEHTRCINRIAFSPIAPLAATSSCDATIKLWDTNSWKVVGELTGHPVAVYPCVFSPDGTVLATATHHQNNDPAEPAEFRLWNVATCECLATWRADAAQTSNLVFLNSGQSILASFRNGALRQWNISTGVAVPQELQCTPDPAPLDSATGQQIMFGNSITPSPSGEQLLYVGGKLERSTFHSLDLQTARSTLIAEGEFKAGSAVFSTDGHFVALVQWNKPLQLRRFPKGQLVAHLAGNYGDPHSAAISFDNLQLAIGTTYGELLVHDLAPFGLIHHRLWGTSSASIGFDAARSWIYACNPGHDLEVRDAVSGELVERHFLGTDHPFEEAIVSPDGKWACCRTSAGTEYFERTNVELRKNGRVQQLGQSRAGAAFSHNSRLLAIGTGKGWALIDVSSGQTIRQVGQSALQRPSLTGPAPSFSHDDRRIVVPVGDSRHPEWSLVGVTSGYFRGFEANAAGVRLSSAGRWAARWGPGMHLDLADADNGKLVHELKGHTHDVRDAAFTPDGRTLASVSLDGTLRLWHVATGQELCILADVGHGLERCHFSDDGQTLVCWSGKQPDGFVDVHVFHLPTKP